ncbi:MAG: DUF2793 domain-containing protein [Rhodobacter sp.]|nr:DUF2793 domain-containing protein [Rhodobacter sp.]
MSETAKFALPLLQPAQAQKHVTVNEALARLDGMTQLTLLSATEGTPPAGAADGDSYAVPPGAVNEWDGHSGEVAVFSNGGWVFIAPSIGWRAWIADQEQRALYDGVSWVPGGLAVSLNRAVSSFRVAEFDHALGAGATSQTSVQIPQYAMVFAVTGRIKTALTGTLTSWDFGVSGSSNRYGSGLGLTQGSWISGIGGQPLTYWSDTPLVLTANGGDFAAGEVRLAIHYYAATPPAI